jgi:thiosulfate/3-mercaptopyruvate sulfurtransferase
MSDIVARGYHSPEVLVSTEWVDTHKHDPKVRLVESNEDPLLYRVGHVPGAVEIDWTRDLNDPLRRDYLQSHGFAALMSRAGISPDTTVVLYGDKNNWWACYAFWVFGSLDIKILRSWMEGERSGSAKGEYSIASSHRILQRTIR